MPVVRCKAPNPKYPSEACNHFVARLPYPVTFRGVVDSSDEADPRNIVVQCRGCGETLEYRQKAPVAA